MSVNYIRAAAEFMPAEPEGFAVICRELELDPDIKISALDTYEYLNANHSLGKDALIWLCCAVYSELQQAKKKDMLADAVTARSKTLKEEEEDEPSSTKSSTQNQQSCWNISLTNLLRAFKLSIGLFLQYMKRWNVLAQHSASFQLRVENLERRCGITMRILQHYKRIFYKLFQQPEARSSEFQCHLQSLYEFGWLLFLSCWNELPGPASLNLVTGFQLLVCVLELVYLNSLEVRGSPIIRLDFPGLPVGWQKEDFNWESLDKYCALDAVCALVPELPVKDVRAMKQAFFHKAVMVLFMEHRLLGNDLLMRELIKDGLLEVNLTSLNRCYDKYVNDIDEMDERILLRYEPKPVKAAVKQRNLQVELLNKLPDSKWEKEFRSLSESQRENLLHLLKQIISAPTILDSQHMKNVQESVREMAQKFETASAGHLCWEDARKRYSFAKSLHEAFVQKIAQGEMARKPLPTFIQLLEQRNFNTILMTSCLQLVLHIFNDMDGSALKFPWLLDSCFDLEAFEFQKILELMVRHHNGLLNSGLVKHLQEIEAECLTILIWRSNSSLWQTYTNKLPNYQSVLDWDGASKENVQQPNSRPAGICMRKLYKLATQRLTYLCDGFSLLRNQRAYSHIWHILEYSITEHGRQLLQNRQLDQLIMCAIHLYARTSELSISFSQILQLYRRQSHACSQVYRSVALTNGKSADIIAFYNQVYVPLMGTYARNLHCQPSPENQVEDTPKENRLPNQQRISPGQNVFVSPVDRSFLCLASNCNKLPEAKRCLSDEMLDTIPKRPNILKPRISTE